MITNNQASTLSKEFLSYRLAFFLLPLGLENCALTYHNFHVVFNAVLSTTRTCVKWQIPVPPPPARKPHLEATSSSSEYRVVASDILFLDNVRKLHMFLIFLYYPLEWTTRWSNRPCSFHFACLQVPEACCHIHPQCTAYRLYFNYKSTTLFFAFCTPNRRTAASFKRKSASRRKALEGIQHQGRRYVEYRDQTRLQLESHSTSTSSTHNVKQPIPITFTIAIPESSRLRIRYFEPSSPSHEGKTFTYSKCRLIAIAIVR